MRDPVMALRRHLDAAEADPTQVRAHLRRAREAALEISGEPYETSRMYLPGLSFPASAVLEIPGIPLVQPGTTSPNVPISLRTPGVVVGLIGATLPDADFIERSSIAFQLTTEASWSFASNGENNSGAFATFAMFGFSTSPCVPVLIPSRGSGGWSVTFRNNGSAAIQPIFNLAFLEGEEALLRCGFDVKPSGRSIAPRRSGAT
jgi:hypothetical protein